MIAIVFAARYLGVESFGVFSSLLAIIGILSKFVDFGIEPIIFREFSKEKYNYHILNSALNLKILIYLLLVAFYNLIALILKFSYDEIVYSNILFTTIIFSAKTVNIRELLATPFKVNLKMHYPMSLAILDNILLIILISFLPLVQNKLFYFILFYSVSSLPGFVFLFYFLKKKFGYRFEATLQKSRWLLKESLPLFGYVILTTIFSHMDVVLLSWYKSSFDVGLYSAGLRLTMPLSIIPGAITTTVFPILMRKLPDKSSFDFISNLVIKLLYIIAFVIAVVFTFESQSIVQLIFGIEYRGAALPASILYWCQIFLFFTFYTLVVLIARNHQFYNFIFGAVQVIVNLGLNFLLIPDYSFLGSAIAKLAASFVSFVFIIIILKRKGYHPSIGRYKTLAWSVILTASMYALSFLPLVPYLILSPVIIGLVTYSVKLFNVEELMVFFRIINKEGAGIQIIKKYRLS